LGTAASLLLLLASPLHAAPAPPPIRPISPIGPIVTQGAATFTTQGSQLTIQTSDQAFINWQSFNIGLGQTTTFLQPSSSSVVWNQINDPNPSQILGTLNANGYVFLQNQAGFYVGGHASINAHGLVMTTAPTPTPNLFSAGAWDFNAPPPSAKIINYGQIQAANGGSAFLIAQDIENHGTIAAPQGQIGLYAGQHVLLSSRPDGRGISATVTLPEGSVDNSGRLIADAGTIAMQAQVVNQGGLVQANSMREVNGVIELTASDAINLGANSVLSAQGGSQGASPGGTISIKSGNTFSDQPASAINVSGGAQAGNGGQVEISAPSMSAIQSGIEGRAASGFLAGKLTIDPQDILLTSSGSPAPASGTVNAGDPPAAGALTLDVNSFNTLISQGSLSQISLQATRDIEVATLWSLPNSQTPNSTLTLEAGRNITIDNYAGLAAGLNWTVNLKAGTELTSAATRISGQDGIYLQGSAFIQTQNGNINLWAGNEVQVATGPTSADVAGNGIRTLNGGSISVTALYGDVNAGANPAGFDYQSSAPYYTVDPGLGGVSTAAGGNVTINAGGNIKSYLPVSTSGSSATADAGSGAFGPEPGNVTLTAHGSIYGHYVLANGVGTIEAGGNVGGPVTSQNLALSLIDGSWSVDAPNGSIYLQEVRNPNGVFNNDGHQTSPGRHLFNYAPSDSVDLTAGIGIDITCQSVPRNDPVPILFPPALTMTAGSGGVTLQDTVILFPSPQGNLDITTTAGGALVTAPNEPGTFPELLMSDSSNTRWTAAGDFSANDHGRTPVEVDNPNPVVVDVSGNMENFTLITTKQTQINVAGNMDNCGFSGQNLHSGDITSINVAGQIYNRSPYSFAFLTQPIPTVPAADVPPGMTVSGTAAPWELIFNLAVNPTAIANLTVPADVLPIQWAAYALGTVGLFPNLGTASIAQRNPGFVYNPTTGRLGFAGTMSPSIPIALDQPLTVLRLGPDGVPLTYVGADGQQHFETTQVSWVDPSVINSLYQASQGAASPNVAQLGYRIGGPGEFDVQAASISLGNTYGILSCGVADVQGGCGRYANLAGLTPFAATLNVTCAGNLEMLTSTIANLGGGNVNVTSVSGSMDLGSEELFNTQRQIGFGILSSGRGNVDVQALGDINIDGSRIAAYDGGSIHVESLQGNVYAGTGGTTFSGAEVSYVDPATGQAGSYYEEVFGSGIVANTLVKPSEVPGGAVSPGNILVDAPRGSIYAGLGGILQEALNGNVSGGPTVTLLAGTPPSASSPGYTGNIDVGDSGVIGGTVNVTANGNINGLVISRQNTTINAAQSFSGTVLAAGTANLTAGGTVSGTVIGVAGISAVGGQGVSAALLSQNVSVGGVAAQGGLASSATASAASQSAAKATEDQSQTTLATTTTNPSNDDLKKRAGKKPTLTRRIGRVTVLLPPKAAP